MLLDHGADIDAVDNLGYTALAKCGDEEKCAEAKALVSELLRSLNMRPIDLGPIRNAATLEHLAVAWIHLAMPAGWGRGIQLAVLGG